MVTSAGMVIRISFSNLFKEFKSTSTWLQFPYRLQGAIKKGCVVGGNEEGGGDFLSSGSKSARWTFLSLNLRDIVAKYLFSSYSYLKNIKLCANVLVKNVFTSDHDYSPMEGSAGPRREQQLTQPLPREMSLPLSKDAEFLEVYDYVSFPLKTRKLVSSPRHQFKGKRSEVIVVADKESNRSGHVTRGDDRPRDINDHVTRSSYHVIRDLEGRDDSFRGFLRGDGELADHCIEPDGLGRGPITEPRCAPKGGMAPSRCVGVEKGGGGGGEVVHVYAEHGADVTIHQGEKSRKNITFKQSKQRVSQPGEFG